MNKRRAKELRKKAFQIASSTNEPSKAERHITRFMTKDKEGKDIVHHESVTVKYTGFRRIYKQLKRSKGGI